MAWCLLAFVRNISDPQDAARAEEAARQSLARDPTWFLSYHQLGWALQGQGRYEEAEVALLDGIAINAAYKSAYDVLGQVQLSLGKYEDALATMQTSLSLGQAPVDLVYLGAAQVLTGDEVGGLESVERAIELGFGDLSAVEGSPYFASVREDPRFQSLLHDARSRSRGDLAR